MFQAPSQRFFAALLLLLIATILAFTLSPFDFTAEITKGFRWRTNLRDSVSNIALFLPFGFLLRLLRWHRPKLLFLPELALGTLLSFGIECLQLFLDTRQSQYSDVLCNAAGAWLGAWSGQWAGRWLGSAGDLNPGMCTSLPLYGLMLLTPVAWLYSLSHIPFSPAMLPLALAGSLAVALLTACLAEESREIGPATAIPLTMAWLLLAFLPYLQRHPAPVLWACLLLGTGTFLVARRLVRREAELDTALAQRLRRLVAALLLLQLAVGLHAGAVPVSWHWNLPLLPAAALADDHGVRLVARTMLFLLLGYFHGSEPLARRQGTLLRAALIASLPPLAILLLLGGWLPDAPFSLAELPLLSLGFAYGILLDALRRAAHAPTGADPLRLMTRERR